MELLKSYENIKNRLRAILYKKSVHATRSGGERQAAVELAGISVDHRARYQFAVERIPAGKRILDIACGVGYGSFMLAEKGGSVTGVDISPDAIAFANKFYKGSGARFHLGDATKFKGETVGYDFVVSFETIEHVPQALEVLKNLASNMSQSGLLYISSPNQDRLPWTKERFPYHVRHFTAVEFENLINEAGLSVVEKFSQGSKKDPTIRSGTDGDFFIFVCKKER